MAGRRTNMYVSGHDSFCQRTKGAVMRRYRGAIML